MRRRDFITLLGAAAAAWPLAARAQQTVVGWLNTAPRVNPDNLSDFRKGLSETGLIEGRDVLIELHAAARYDELPTLAADLVRQRTAVIVASALPAALAAKAATNTIPIVFFAGADPIRAGLVASLNHPGGNLTGVTNLNSSLLLKRLGLLRELVPNGGLIAVLVNPNNPITSARLSALQDAADSVRQKLIVVTASREDELATAFATAVQQHAVALLVIDDQFLGSRSDQLAMLAMAHRLPTSSFSPQFVAAGGLIMYAAAPGQVYPQVGTYVGRILKGERPADLPVIQPTKFELVVNLKTARTLGLTVPQTLLAIADKVIE